MPEEETFSEAEVDSFYEAEIKPDFSKGEKAIYGLEDVRELLAEVRKGESNLVLAEERHVDDLQHLLRVALSAITGPVAEHEAALREIVSYIKRKLNE